MVLPTFVCEIPGGHVPPRLKDAGWCGHGVHEPVGTELFPPFVVVGHWCTVGCLGQHMVPARVFVCGWLFLLWLIICWLVVWLVGGGGCGV